MDLSSSEYKEMIKTIRDVAPKISSHESKNGHHCRHCTNNETYTFEYMPHILGKYPFGDLLRN